MTNHSCRFWSLYYWYGALPCLFLLLFFDRMANDKANASFHKQYCGGQDGNALCNATVFMFQVQELCEEAVSKDQILKVYPLFVCMLFQSLLIQIFFN